MPQVAVLVLAAQAGPALGPAVAVILEQTRFAGLVGPHDEKCRVPVLLLTGARGGDLLVEAQPHRDGTFLLRDTGGDAPVAVATTVAQRFGRQDQLHRRHECRETRTARRAA